MISPVAPKKTVVLIGLTILFFVTPSLRADDPCDVGSTRWKSAKEFENEDKDLAIKIKPDKKEEQTCTNVARCYAYLRLDEKRTTKDGIALNRGCIPTDKSGEYPPRTDPDMCWLSKSYDDLNINFRCSFDGDAFKGKPEKLREKDKKIFINTGLELILEKLENKFCFQGSKYWDNVEDWKKSGGSIEVPVDGEAKPPIAPNIDTACFLRVSLDQTKTRIQLKRGVWSEADIQGPKDLAAGTDVPTCKVIQESKFGGPVLACAHHPTMKDDARIKAADMKAWLDAGGGVKPKPVKSGAERGPVELTFFVLLMVSMVVSIIPCVIIMV